MLSKSAFNTSFFYYYNLLFKFGSVEDNAFKMSNSPMGLSGIINVKWGMLIYIYESVVNAKFLKIEFSISMFSLVFKITY